MKAGVLNQRGTATIELALTTTLMLTVLLGIVEFGNALSVDHTITSLTREGANIASRGSTLQEAVQVVVTNGSSVRLDSRGGVIASRMIVQGGVPRVQVQEKSSGFSGASKLGAPGDQIKSMASMGFQDGQTVYVVEVFYDYQPMTPFGNVAGFPVPSTIYERAVF